MLELLDKLDQLKKELNECRSMKELLAIQKEILNDQELYEKLQKKDMEALQDEKVYAYRNCENEVNFLILEINKCLKEQLGGCQ